MASRLIAVLVTLAFSSAVQAWGTDCEFKAARDLDIDAKSLSRLDLSTGAGDLRIEGVAGLQRVELRGQACASSAELLEQIRLDQRTDGDALLVGTLMPTQKTGWSLFGDNDYAFLDLTLRVPQRMLLKLRDSSGDIDVRDVAAVDVADSSGDVELRDIAGDVAATDSSGDLRFENVGGNVTIPSDSSGDVRVDHVRGSVEVDVDSSGDIVLENIDGNARVGRDSSGDIDFRAIGRDAIVGSDSSGSISARQVRGGFSVEAKSTGADNISFADIGGAVNVPKD
jgi:DUF4097 and DUF4098 domain-containing protein YvlB